MIEAISATGVESAQAGIGAAQSPQASQQDVRDFSASMAKAGGTEATTAASGPNAPGGAARALLETFDGVNGSVRNIRELVAKGGSGANGEFAPSEILQLTVECHEFMFKTQLTSNVANRTSDGIQQLFRQQS